MKKGQKIVEGLDRGLSIVISMAWGAIFGSVANAGQASDLDEATIPGSNDTKLTVVFPILFGASLARTLIGIAEYVITGKEIERRLAEALPADQADPGVDLGDNFTPEEAKYTTLCVGVDLVLARAVPTILFGVIAFDGRDPTYLLLATQASITLKQFLHIIFNSCILAAQDPEQRQKRQYLAEPFIGLLTAGSLGVATYEVFSDSPDDPSSTYTDLGMGAAGVQLILHTLKLLHLLCCVPTLPSNHGMVRLFGDEEGAAGADGADELLIDQQGDRGDGHNAKAGAGQDTEQKQQQQRGGGHGGDEEKAGEAAGAGGDAALEQSPSMFRPAVGAAGGLVRIKSGMAPQGKRFATLEPAGGENKDAVLLRTFSQTKDGDYLAPSASGGHLVPSASKRTLSIQQLSGYGAVGFIQANGDLQAGAPMGAAGERSTLRMTVVQQGILPSMWNKATKPTKPAGRGGGGGGGAGGDPLGAPPPPPPPPPPLLPGAGRGMGRGHT